MDPPLPTEIMDDVLSRLAVKSVIRFRCVSKSWKKQLTCPYFVDKHLKKNKYGLKRIMVTPEKMYSFDEGGKPCHEQGVGVSKVKGHDVVWGSCDGLVCIGYSWCWFELSLWNPSTGKSKNIGDLRQFPVFEPRILWVVYGFGYNAATNDYQVVGIQFWMEFLSGTLPSQVIIYSLRSNTWRTLQDEINYSVRKDQKGTLVNGSLHWMARIREEHLLAPVQYNIILAFDISREEFSEVPHRSNQIGIDDDYVTIHLTELDGKLGAVYYYKTRFELWVMKSYGDMKSWSMLFNIVDNHPKNDLKLCDSVPMCFINESQALMIHRRRKLFLYDVKAQTAIPIEEFQIPLPQENLYTATSYVESLVALD